MLFFSLIPPIYNLFPLSSSTFAYVHLGQQVDIGRKKELLWLDAQSLCSPETFWMDSTPVFFLCFSFLCIFMWADRQSLAIIARSKVKHQMSFFSNSKVSPVLSCIRLLPVNRQTNLTHFAQIHLTSLCDLGQRIKFLFYIVSRIGKQASYIYERVFILSVCLLFSPLNYVEIDGNNKPIRHCQCCCSLVHIRAKVFWRTASEVSNLPEIGAPFNSWGGFFSRNHSISKQHNLFQSIQLQFLSGFWKKCSVSNEVFAPVWSVGKGSFLEHGIEEKDRGEKLL